MSFVLFCFVHGENNLCCGGGEYTEKKKNARVKVRSFFAKGSKMPCQGETCCLRLNNYPDFETVIPVMPTL